MAKDAVEEFLSMKKTAGPEKSMMARFGGHAAKAGVGALAAGIGAAGAVGIGMAVSKIVDAATKSHDFKMMLENNQDLHSKYQEDPKRFNMMFSTLRTMNPQFSKDPLVAGTFMRRMVMSPEGIGGIAGEALTHRGDFEQPLMEAFGRGAGAGAGSGLQASFKGEEPKDWDKDPSRQLEFEKQKMDYQHGLRQQDADKKEYTETYEGGSDTPNRMQVKFRK